jgi:hypothetical protein
MRERRVLPVRSLQNLARRELGCEVEAGATRRDWLLMNEFYAGFLQLAMRRANRAKLQPERCSFTCPAGTHRLP